LNSYLGCGYPRSENGKRKPEAKHLKQGQKERPKRRERKKETEQQTNAGTRLFFYYPRATFRA